MVGHLDPVHAGREAGCRPSRCSLCPSAHQRGREGPPQGRLRDQVSVAGPRGALTQAPAFQLLSQEVTVRVRPTGLCVWGRLPLMWPC